MTVTIRPARPGDESGIVRLVRALAEYERAPEAVMLTDEALAEHLFAEPAHVFAHVAEREGRLVGMAVWYPTFSTWTGRPGIHLEDLFVEPPARGAGVAAGLVRALAAEAGTRGWARLDWAVLDWNEPAKGFYRRLGARHHAGWECWRLDGEALGALARPGPLSPPG